MHLHDNNIAFVGEKQCFYQLTKLQSYFMFFLINYKKVMEQDA